METRAVTPADRREAPPEPAGAPPVPSDATPDPRAADAAPALAWAGDDALSEFPTEADARSRPRPATGHPRPNGNTGALAVAGALVVLALMAFAAWRLWPSRAENPAPTGTLAVESVPAGATVVIEGRERGKTPLMLPLPAGTYKVTVNSATESRELSVTIAAGMQVVHHVELREAAPTTGRLQVNAPAGARIVLDGTRRGVAPAELTGIPAGEHVVTVGEGTAAVTQRVAVPAGGLASLLAPLGQTRDAPAWVSVLAPIELQVFDGQTLVGSSTTERILVLAGKHTLRLVSTGLGYQTTRTVDLQGGRTAVLRIEVPNGRMNVNALPWAEVFVDGKRVGETPIANLAVPIGPHEVTLRNPKFAEQRRSVVISLAGPTRVGVDLRQ